MTRNVISTHAGDDSDGKIWGLEGVNILFMVGGLVLSIGLVLMLTRNHAVAFSVAAGSLPFLVVTTYVLGLRQGRPKSYDSDLLETLSNGTGWMPPTRQPINPLSSHASS